MMKEMGISQHNMCSCSLTAAGDVLFVCTSNGVDVEHNYIPAPDAPSFFAMDKNTGKVLWTDKSPGLNIHHGQWSSPTYGVIDGQAAGDLRRRRRLDLQLRPRGRERQKQAAVEVRRQPQDRQARADGQGNAQRHHLDAGDLRRQGLRRHRPGSRAWRRDRHALVHRSDEARRREPGAGVQRLRPEERRFRTSASRRSSRRKATSPGRIPNSAVVWEYSSRRSRRRQGHRVRRDSSTAASARVAIRDDILYIADFSGLFHCLDAKTGKVNWVYDMLVGRVGLAADRRGQGLHRRRRRRGVDLQALGRSRRKR